MWMISKNGKKSEPMTEEKVREMIKAGEVSGHDLAKSDEMGDWIPLKNFKKFQNHFLSEQNTLSLDPALGKMIYLFAWFGWFLSLLGFLIYWFIIDVGKPSFFDNGTVDFYRMSIKSNGIIAFGLILIVISMYLIAYKILNAVTRIEKALSEKMKEEA